MLHIHNFLEHLASLNYSAKTIEIRKTCIKKFQKWNTLDLKDVTEKTVRDFLILEKRSINTHNTYLLSLRQFFNYLEKEFVIFSNPALEIQCLKDKRLPRVISEEQVLKVLESIDIHSKEGKRHKAIFELLYSTGIRRAELLDLKLVDIDIINGTLKVFGKGSKERFVPFGDAASQSLEAYLDSGRPVSQNEYLFLKADGSQLTPGALEGAVRMLKAKAGVTFSCHTLRRSCATHLLDNGASPLIIAELLGHENLKTLSQYLKVSIKEIKMMHHKSRLGK